MSTHLPKGAANPVAERIAGLAAEIGASGRLVPEDDGAYQHFVTLDAFDADLAVDWVTLTE